MHSNSNPFAHHGLTHPQYIDCIKAGRSPKTGRRFRTSSPSEKERNARKHNWNALIIKGAKANLDHLLYQLDIPALDRSELRLRLDLLIDDLVSANKVSKGASDKAGESVAKLSNSRRSWDWDDPDTYGPA